MPVSDSFFKSLIKHLVQYPTLEIFLEVDEGFEPLWSISRTGHLIRDFIRSLKWKPGTNLKSVLLKSPLIKKIAWNYVMPGLSTRVVESPCMQWCVIPNTCHVRTHFIRGAKMTLFAFYLNIKIKSKNFRKMIDPLNLKKFMWNWQI